MILNLAYPEKSDILFKVNKFPDGQQSIEVSPNSFQKKFVTIYARMCDFKDVELIICATKALRNIGVEKISLFVPYFIGGRSDIDFTRGMGGVHYIKDVIAPIINMLDFEQVKVLDPHSTVMEGCLNHFKYETNHAFIAWVMIQLSKVDIVYAPDAGASKKIYPLLRDIKWSGRVIIGDKERDISTGKIIRTVINCEDLAKAPVLIIDDICDGGRTFIEAGKALKAKNAGKLYLAVTHGIFSQGYGELANAFEVVFCTNSYKDLPESVTNTEFFKQINVF